MFSQQTENYPPINSGVKLENTNLPIFFINTEGQEIAKDSRILARMKIINNQSGEGNYGDTIAYPKQYVDYNGNIMIKYRGNSSYRLSEKKPYSIHLVNTDGSKRIASILGLPEHNDWVLLSLHIDKSMVREALTFILAERYFDYSPRVRHCEVILNGIYYGVYLLIEHIRRGEGRLNIKKPGVSDDALTGGYLVEIDRNESQGYLSKHPPVSSDGSITFTDKPIFFQYKDPDGDNIKDKQKMYIDNLIGSFEDALSSPDYKNPETGYRKYIDVTSFINYQLIQEITNNCDAYRLSTYLYKYRDSVDPRFKLTIWDFDRAWGKTRRLGYLTDIWAYQNNDRLTQDDETFIPFWWTRLMQDEYYVDELKNRYKKYRQEAFSNLHINATIDSLVNLLTIGGAIERNNLAWPRWGIIQKPEYYVATSFEDEIDWLKKWIYNRLEWMDSQLAETSDIEIPRNPLSSEGEIYSLIGIRVNNIKGLKIIRQPDGKTIKKLSR